MRQLTQLTLKKMKERGEHFPPTTVQAKKSQRDVMNRQRLSIIGERGFWLHGATV